MSPKKNEITVVLVEDHGIFVEGLNSVLAKIPDVVVTATFTNGIELLAYLPQHPTDLILLDISLSGSMSGIEICRAIRQSHKKTKVIALSNHTEKHIIHEMLSQGAHGYLLKNVSFHELQNAVEQVLKGQFVMSEEVRELVFSPSGTADKIPRLTAREKEVLQWISEGLTTQQIAEKLFISTQTVESHRYNLLQKFETPNSVTLVKKAIGMGLLEQS